MTPVELRRATVGYPDAAIRTAVVAGLRECPIADVPADTHFADVVMFWLTDPDSRGWFTHPQPANTTAAIRQHLAARAD